MGFFEDWLKQTAVKSGKEAGSTFIQEVAETMTVEQLSSLIRLLNKVLERKKNVVEMKVK